ncbi:MAG TPA: hypothetical protein VE397_06625, partial [Stellaceae bacterium]|nr:hypothetical protein [Stellaceae bacterium]
AFYDGVLRLAGDPERRQRLGGNARRFAESRFDVEAKAALFEEAFAAALRPVAQQGRIAGLKPA